MAIIYGLADPDTLETRYVGETNRPMWRRWAAHLGTFSRSAATGVRGWIEDLLKQGKTPIIYTIEDLGEMPSRKERMKIEQVYIRILRGWGCDLLNMQIGQGPKGRPLSDEHKRQQVATARSKDSYRKGWEIRRSTSASETPASSG